MEDYLSNLNDQQRSAVECIDKPQLVIAGAGSGKTRVLTYKIVHLLAHGYEPWRILALTFTNKAAREMRERIMALVGEKIASKLWMGTFHSIFARILRANAELIGYKSNFTIYDTSDSKSLIKMIIKDLGLDEKAYKPSVVANSISRAKNHLVDPTMYANDYDIRMADRRAKMDRLYEIYAGYVNRCRVAGAMDFDDLLYYTYKLFSENHDVLHHYEEFFQYVLVDEYQDTNYAQHKIITLLTKDSQRLCVVGDDAQSIYSFRGAVIGNILNLKRDYPELRTFKLEQNYRSTQSIVQAANSLIEKNSEQIPKNVFSLNAKGERIEVQQSYSDFEEAYIVSNRLLQKQQATGDTFEDFVILYRTNAQSRVLEEALRKRNIPYRIYGGLSFYQRKEVKDAVAYFRLSINPHDDEAIKRVINYPARGIGETTLKKLSAAAISNSVSLWTALCDIDKYCPELKKAARERLNGFKELIISFNRLNGINTEGKPDYASTTALDAFEVATKIIQNAQLMSVLFSDRTPESISRQENLQELINGAQEFVNNKIEEGDLDSIFMSNFLGEISLSTDQDESEDDRQEKVTLMTIHAAKGLEFGNVFIVGVEDDLLPSAMAKDSPSEIEEERRLLYVAITRAKRFCMITFAKSRFRNGSTVPSHPSPFLHDIDSAWLNYTMGTSMPMTNSKGYDIKPCIRPASSQFSSKPPTISTRPTANRPNHSTPPQSFTSQSTNAAVGASLHTPGELEIGMRIEHNRFGPGKIVDIDTSQPDAKIRVQFDNVDVKTLLLKFARFNIL